MNGPLCILLLTYGANSERVAYAHRTLRAAIDNIHYSGPLKVHIADDGSPGAHMDALAEVAGGYAHIASVTVSNAHRGGYGRSYNLATQIVHKIADYVLPIEDDWELMRPLDLDPLVATLAEDHSFGCIRLGYIGFTQELRGTVLQSSAGMMLRFDPNSDEPHVWAGHPRLETVAWQLPVGPWPEGLAAGATEWEVAHRWTARQGVAWPLDLVHPRGDLFAHIGTVGLGELAPEGVEVAT